MTKDQLITALRNDLSVMMDWARELGDEYLDGDQDTRHQYLADMESARETLKLKPEEDPKLKKALNDLEFICQWVVDLDEGKFMDSNDCEYFNGVDEAKAHLQELQINE